MAPVHSHRASAEASIVVVPCAVPRGVFACVSDGAALARDPVAAGRVSIHAQEPGRRHATASEGVTRQHGPGQQDPALHEGQQALPAVRLLEHGRADIEFP
jgi:hypothetical protein